MQFAVLSFSPDGAKHEPQSLVEAMNSTTRLWVSGIFIGILTLIVGILVANTLLSNPEVTRTMKKFKEVKAGTATGNIWFETKIH